MSNTIDFGNKDLNNINNITASGTVDANVLKLNSLYHQNLSVANGIDTTDMILMINDPSGTPTTQVLLGSTLRNSLLDQPAVLRLRQGTDVERLSITPANGEPIWTTDTQKLYIGDGSTVGGDLIGPPDGSSTPYSRPSGVQNVLVSNSGCSIGIGSDYSSILGGQSNSISNSGDYSVVVGGSGNIISSNKNGNFIGGGTIGLFGAGQGFNNKIGSGCVSCSIVGGSTNSIIGTTNQPIYNTNYSNIIGGGSQNSIVSTGSGSMSYGEYTNNNSILAGQQNTLTGTTSSIICGGQSNSMNSCYNSLIAAGRQNNIIETISSYSDSAAIIAGANNSLYLSSGGVLGGGNGNIISSSYSSFIGGGNSNYLGGAQNSCIVGGSSNTITGTANSFIGGGDSNTIAGNNNLLYATIPGGLRARATKYGELSHAAGRFANNGDAQHTILIPRRSTTDATSNVVLTLGGGTPSSTSRLIIPAKTTWTFSIKVSAYNDTDGEGAWWTIRGGIRRNASNGTALIGSLIAENGADTSLNTANVSVVADDTNEALEINVTGVASKNIRWVAVVDLCQVSYGIP